MSKDSPKLQTWQFWQLARKYFGVGYISKLYGVSNRTIYDYAQDPTATEERGKLDPIQRLHALLTRFDDLGFGQYARAVIAYLKTAVEDSHCPGEIQEPHPSISEEILRDYRAVAKLQEAIDQGEDPEMVALLRDEAKSEIDRTYIRYGKKFSTKNSSRRGRDG